MAAANERMAEEKEEFQVKSCAAEVPDAGDGAVQCSARLPPLYSGKGFNTPARAKTWGSETIRPHGLARRSILLIGEISFDRTSIRPQAGRPD
nr:hypothetical protein CFP56_04519 [Quercus suber]